VELMSKVTVRTACLIVLAFAASPPLRAQQVLTARDAASLRAAKNEVFVQLASTPAEIHGRLTTFDAAALTLEVDGRSYTFPPDEVLRIDTIGGTNRHKLVRGALIGGLVTGAWCALVCGQGVDSRSEYSMAVVGNGGLGAAIGGLIGFMREGRETIYKSAGTGAAISRPPSELPCPATPLVLEADLSPIDLRKLSRTWTPVPQSRGFGTSRCDGVTIQRRYDRQTGQWQPGVEIAGGLADDLWIDVRVRVTVRNLQSERDTRAHVTVALNQDGRAQVTAIGSINADADEESRGDVWLRVPRALLSRSSSSLSLQLTLTTSYPR
jgi:hypothetical protein